MKYNLVDQDGKEVLFRKGMGIHRFYSEPGLVHITPPIGERISTQIYFGRGDKGGDNKRALNVDRLEEVAFLIAHILGLDVVKNTSINPAVGEGYRLI